MLCIHSNSEVHPAACWQFSDVGSALLSGGFFLAFVLLSPWCLALTSGFLVLYSDKLHSISIDKA